MNYPYLVIRIMAAAYEHVPIEGFGENDCKESLIEHIIDYKKQKKTNKSMCIVFSENECVYINPDNTTEESDSPPSGGIILSEVL